MRETTALGAAIAAGLALGLWRNFTELRDINRAGGAVFEPSVPPEKSAEMFGLWEKAVHMSKGWVKKDTENANQVHNTRKPSVIANGKPKESVFVTQTVFSDLDAADEEDLLLELRKIEIQQRLKRLRKGLTA
jgi:glycerol kinase